MRHPRTSSQESTLLHDIVGLKWLMAGEGVHVHVERLQSEPAYARECLSRAARSSNPTARDTAARLSARLWPTCTAG
jgi:hypothetical protein